jgi:putative CocE/NonD family hydrolase
MRDGVELSADIYSPSTSGRFPVIVVRNPYTKSAQWAQRGRWWAERGYVFVVQDVRGRGDSDGEFYPLVNEANDGTDT